jgi:LysR family transcriptional regulator for bpeEF and oprC
MDQLSAMRTFVAVVEAGGFSRAAQKLGVANATVTEAVKQLEEHLGAQLLNRTTRSVRPTYEGAAYFSRCQGVLAEIDEIEEMISESHSTPRGRLIVEVPAGLGYLFIVPALKQFSEENPDIKIVVLLDPGPKRLVEGGIDLALQLGDLKDSNLISRKIASTKYVTCASSDYIAQHGAPEHPSELKDKNCMGFFAPHSGRIVEWNFSKGAKKINHVPTGTPNFNSSIALIDAAERGIGIIYTLDLLVRSQLRDGKLVSLLTDWKSQQRPLYIVYPQKRYLPSKVKTFIKFIEGLDFETMP